MQRPDTEDGLFHAGDPLTGTKGTPITAAWLNALIATIEGGGGVGGGGLTIFPSEPTQEQIDALLLRDVNGVLTDITGFYMVWNAPAIPDTTPPEVTGFTVPATSGSTTISGITLTATDNVGVTGFKLTESSTPPLYSDAGWSGSAPTTYDAGSNGEKTLYAWAKDAAGNVSALYAAQTCTVTAVHAPTFSIQPTANNQIDGAIFSFTVADALGHTVDVEFYSGSAWSRILSGVAVGAKTHAWTGQAAGNKAGCKFRVSDAGADAWVESSVVTTFSTSTPTIASVTPGDTQLTIDITAPSGETPDSYNGYHSATAGQAIGSMTQVVGIADPWVLPGLTNGAPRYVKVTAVKGGVESLASVEDSGTPATAAGTLYLSAFDPAKKGTHNVLTNADLTVENTGSAAAWSTAFTLDGKTTGLWRHKFYCDNVTTTGTIFGICDATLATDMYLGGSTLGTGWHPTGANYYNGSPSASALAGGYTIGATLLMEFDCATRKARISINDGATWTPWSPAITGTGAIYVAVSCLQPGKATLL